jgi:GNAT superfamily N-acetyltransferase
VALALAPGAGIEDLLTKPAHLALETRGAGSALMEYIVRRATAKGETVSLVPLNSAALRVYTAWGFTGNMQGMLLEQEARPAAAREAHEIRRACLPVTCPTAGHQRSRAS